MNLLLDTCTLLWWWGEPENLSQRIRGLLIDPANSVWVSAASAWEISTKHRIGKYPNGGKVISAWDERLTEDGFRELNITSRHAVRAGTLPGEHRDPFDRMLAAQGMLENLLVASPDSAISRLGAECVW